VCYRLSVCTSISECNCILFFPLDTETYEYGVLNGVLLWLVLTVYGDVTLETPNTVLRECKVYITCRVVRNFLNVNA
jgi:hypothetical protein